MHTDIASHSDMIELVAATLGMWVLLSLYFIGFGSGIIRLALGQTPQSLMRAFWLGWAAWLGVLQVVHLFVGLSAAWVTGLLCVVGGIGLFTARPRALALMSQLRGAAPRTWLWLAFAFVFATWLANRAHGPLLSVDSGLYHLTSIKWAADSPLFVGLGNLHGRLAFNNATFLWLASLDAWPTWFRGFNVGPALLMFTAVAQFIHRIRASDSMSTPESMFRAILILPLVYAATVMHVSSTGPDWVVLVLGTVLATELWDLLAQPNDEQASERLVAIAAISAAGIATKLSFAAYAFAAIALATAWLWRERKPHHTLRPFWAALSLTLFLLVPWSARSIALSGYPAYPSTFAAQDVSWRVPTERAVAEMQWIQSWARAPGKDPKDVLGNRDWVRPWISARLRNADSVTLFVIPGALFVLALFMGAVRRHDPARSALIAALPAALSIATWFATAPDPRFLGAAVWTCAAAAIAAGVSRIKSDGRRHRFTAAAGVCAIASLAFTVYMGSIVGGLFVKPGRDAGRYPIRPVATTPFTTDSGLVLNVPKVGQQCWDAPLPCTPYPAPRLGLRDPDFPSSGFELK